jgi:branched-chain amino acid transport system substrate-binding protein
MGRLPRRVLSAALFLVLLGNVLKADSRAADNAIQLNAMLSLTGAAAALGTDEQEVLQALEAEVNRTGGIRGRPIAFTYLDDASDPRVAIQLTNGLKAKDVPVIVGPNVAATCSAILPLIQTGGPVSFCFSPAIYPASGSNMFTAGVAAADTYRRLLIFAQSRKWKSLGLITPTDATGQDASKQIRALAESPQFSDLHLVAIESFAPADLSVAAQIAKIKAAKPEALLAIGTGVPFGIVMHGVRDGGLTIPVIANGGNMSYKQMAQDGDFLPDKLFFNGARGLTVDPSAPGRIKNAQKAFADALRAKGTRPSYSALLAWDPAMLVVDTLRKLGPTASATEIAGYIGGLQGWAGICGIYDFRKSPQRGIDTDAAAVYQWNALKKDFVVTK